MKTVKSTNIKTIYKVDYYELVKSFPVRIPMYDHQDNLRYYDTNNIHQGSYVKKWSLKFDKHSKLVDYLKTVYKKQLNSKTFYYSIKDALKYESGRICFLIINIVTQDNEGYVYSFKKKKKYKKVRTYHCDCFKCSGAPYEKIQRKKMKDDKKLFDTN